MPSRKATAVKLGKGGNGFVFAIFHYGKEFAVKKVQNYIAMYIVVVIKPGTAGWHSLGFLKLLLSATLICMCGSTPEAISN